MATNLDLPDFCFVSSLFQTDSKFLEKPMPSAVGRNGEEMFLPPCPSLDILFIDINPIFIMETGLATSSRAAEESQPHLLGC